jgi:predicted anti-sigma-YlaC factor YlaD
MMTCKDVATRLSTGGLEDQSLAKRIVVVVHLAMCRNCRSFARQLAWLKRASRSLGDTIAGELPADFEARLHEHLTRPREDRTGP